MKRFCNSARIQRLTAPLLLLVFLGGCTASNPGSVSTPQTGRGLRLHEIQASVLGELSARTVRQRIPLREGDTVNPRTLAAARDTLANHLSTLPGYPYASITTWEVQPLGPHRVDLLVTIQPGPFTLVESASITGLPAEYEEQILPLLRTRPGHPFDAMDWNRDIRAVHQNLLERGPPFARVITHPLVPASHNDTVRVTAGMEIVPGRRVTLDRVEISGLKRTRPLLAAHAARLPTGVLYRPERLKDGRRNLLATGWFSDVQPGELLRDREGRYGVLYRVQEGAAGSVSGVLGVAGRKDGGLAGALDISLINILGTGRSAEISWRRDLLSLISFRVAYREPFLFGGPLSLNVTLSQEAAESSWVALDSRAELYLDLGTGWRIRGAVGRRGVHADSLATGPDSVDYSLASLFAAVELDTRDRILNPSSGGLYRAGAERGWALGNRGPQQLDRTTLDMEQVVPLVRGWVGFAGLHGVETRVPGGGTPPVAEWARIGGAATLRGFNERSLVAPRVGWLNLEVRRLLGGDSRAFLLADFGVLDGESNGTAWKSAWGFGLQVGVGVGTLQAAFALPSGEGFSATVVHLIASTRF